PAVNFSFAPGPKVSTASLGMEGVACTSQQPLGMVVLWVKVGASRLQLSSSGAASGWPAPASAPGCAPGPDPTPAPESAPGAAPEASHRVPAQTRSALQVPLP